MGNTINLKTAKETREEMCAMFLPKLFEEVERLRLKTLVEQRDQFRIPVGSYNQIVVDGLGYALRCANGYKVWRDGDDLVVDFSLDNPMYVENYVEMKEDES